MASEPTPSKGGKLSLYANLLDPSAESAPGTISRAPVVFKHGAEADAETDESAAKKQQLNPAFLRFQPTKRPQLNQKPKPKPTLPKTGLPSNPLQAGGPAAAPIKTKLEDWAATEEDDYYDYQMGEKRQRGGRKKRKKNREPQMMLQNWDDIYDPSRPNSYEEYRHSDEKVLEIREWKDRLYAHRMKRSPTPDSDSDDDRPVNRSFAPPASFAPPPNLNDTIPPPPSDVPDDPTGEDAFARRARMSSTVDSAPSQRPRPSSPSPPSEAPLHLSSGTDHPVPQPSDQRPSDTVPPPTLPRPLDAFQPSSATIARAPVRYTLPPPPEDIPASQAELEEMLAGEEAPETEDSEDAPRSKRPGQKGFAERQLAKYGWTKGSGLGATGSGIINPLQVKVEKRKKRPDAEGGGFVGPGGRGKIIGGKKGQEDGGKFGAMSPVVILRGMLDGMDLDEELNREGGGLIQEIGEECNEKYGRVERVYIARDVGPPMPVFIKFTNELSALRAVNALEGRVFNGNTISARFFDPEKFEQGEYVD
ncbi:Uncharacterized protein PECH_001755 [Penicillium ucsense]|uniref:G-patch domain-containing protein n=1 Tax=Penicillium ucsense TaxID=2839758 RepID=A0A8J8W9V8_9EURO|nr:Uncharacterized protein PECM_008054 [Penicillium ucsense]KAF7738112.1 Uncharacterized protein PECH_001755 [Penicillium ucsense]